MTDTIVDRPRLLDRVAPLKNRTVAAVATLAFLVGFTSTVAAAEKAKKPVVCIDYDILRSAKTGRELVVCHDGKRPFIFSGQVAIAKLPDGTPIAVGYR